MRLRTTATRVPDVVPLQHDRAMSTPYSSGTIDDSLRRHSEEPSSDDLTPTEWQRLIRVVNANLVVRTAWIPLNIPSQKRIHDKFQRLGWLDDNGFPSGALATYIDVSRAEFH